MAPRLGEKRQRLTLDLPPDLPRALADPGRVRQILTNLLTNAHLYTDEGGHLTVSCGRVAAPHLVLEVSDTGRGMSEEEVEHVFDRFYRGSRRRAPERRDRARPGDRQVARRPARRQHRRRSQPGEGTTFAVSLPRASEPGDLPAQRRALRGRRVLVVDDEPEIAELIAARLEPFEVETRVGAQRRARRSSGCAAEHFDADHARHPDAGHERLRGAAHAARRPGAARHPGRRRVGVLGPRRARGRVGRQQADRRRRARRRARRGGPRRPGARCWWSEAPRCAIAWSPRSSSWDWSTSGCTAAADGRAACAGAPLRGRAGRRRAEPRPGVLDAGARPARPAPATLGRRVLAGARTPLAWHAWTPTRCRSRTPAPRCSPCSRPAGADE